MKTIWFKRKVGENRLGKKIASQTVLDFESNEANVDSKIPVWWWISRRGEEIAVKANIIVPPVEYDTQEIADKCCTIEVEAKVALTHNVTFTKIVGLSSLTYREASHVRRHKEDEMEEVEK